MDTTYFAGTYDIFQYSVRLKENMFAVTDLDLFAYNRIDEGKVGQATVEQVRQRFDDLAERGFTNEHRMEDTVRRIRLGVLTNTTARERSVSYIHREEQIINSLLPINRQDHMLRLVLDDGSNQSEEIIDVMAAKIILERLRLFAAKRPPSR